MNGPNFCMENLVFSASVIEQSNRYSEHDILKNKLLIILCFIQLIFMIGSRELRNVEVYANASCFRKLLKFNEWCCE
jgi:hypothetical protein